MSHELRRKLRRILGTIILFGQDALFLGGAFLLAYWLRFESHWSIFKPTVPQNITIYWAAFLIAIYVILTKMVSLHLYNIDRLQSWKDEAAGVTQSVSLSAIILLAATFFYREIDFSRLMVLMAWPLAIVWVSLGRAVFRGLLTFAKLNGRLCRPVLFIGNGPMLEVLWQKVKEHPGMGLRAAGHLGQKAGLPESIRNLGQVEDLAAVIRAQRISLVFLVEDDFDHEKVLELIEICENEHVELLLVPQVYDLLIGYSGVRDLYGLPLVELREDMIRVRNLVVKRILDVLLSCTFIVLTLPLQLAIILAIKINSKGPAFFLQDRVGYRGRPFKMFKFRTMVVNAEEKLQEVIDLKNMHEPVFKVKDDPRVTRIGRYLRRTSLDELPQLYNVLWGDMSLVGPRPEERRMVERYNVWQRRRLKIKPGITGLQQIKCRGSNSLAERVKYDIFYIRRQSLLFDLEILMKTLWVVASGKGAY